MKKRSVIIIFLSVIFYNLAVYLLYYFESNIQGGNILNIRDAYWYSIVTLTTVGYGDFYPITFWGRMIGFLFVLGSLGILGVLVTELSRIISNYKKKKKEGYFGTTMENHCVIIGWDNFSQQVATQIIKADKKLAIITDKKEDVDKIGLLFSKDDCFVCLSDLKQYNNFKRVNIDKAERVYLNFAEDAETLVQTINLRKNYTEVTFVVALDNMELKSTFNYMGVEFVISKNEIASKLIASYIFEPNVALFAEDLLATSESKEELDIYERKLSSKSPLLEQDYLVAFMQLKKEYNIVLLGISRGGKLFKNPEQLSFKQEDVLVFIGNNKECKQLELVI